MNEKYLSMSVVKLESIESINEFFMNFEHFNSLDRSVLYQSQAEKPRRSRRGYKACFSN